MGRFFAVSQWDFFKEVNIYPDVVLKFMDLPDCLRKLPFVTSDLSIPRINRTKHAPFMEYYSREEEILVWEQEREDFEQFQYERLQPIVRRVLCPVENQYKL